MANHQLRYEVNCSILFTELPLLERPAAVKAAGFDAVEFWWPFAEAVPSDRDVDAFVRAVEDAGVQLVGLNFFAGDMPAGDRGLVSWPARSAEFRDNIDVTVGIGERLFREMAPEWLRIGGYWYPRGGIPIDVFWQSGPPPAGLWLPDQGVAPYRGRGYHDVACAEATICDTFRRISSFRHELLTLVSTI